MSQMKNIAVLGATGAVGAEILKTLERRKFPVGRLKLLASSRSAGTKLRFKGKEIAVEEVTPQSFQDVQIGIFSAGATRSLEFAPHAVKAGAVVIDNSSAYRMDPAIPLVVPEVNPDDVRLHKGIIANPNCTAAIMAVALWPLHQAAVIKRIIVSTYQAASGAGAKAMQELEDQSRDILAGREPKKEVLPHQIAFNVFSHNAEVADNGYNGEENKVAQEMQKMFHAPGLKICATCIRVPVMRAHSESIVIETEQKLSPEDAVKILGKAPGIRLVNDARKNYYPMPIEASGEFDVLVGRIRRDLSAPEDHGLALFVSGDQLLKGAALNAVQIAEMLP
jgi:aspartate-semialdehyde dehydrogenase